jgi:hypothetical protein
MLQNYCLGVKQPQQKGEKSYQQPQENTILVLSPAETNMSAMFTALFGEQDA